MANAKKRLGMFADVREILDAAIAAGGGEYTLATHGAAVHWRQRAYTFRKLFAEAIGGPSPYDTLTLRRVAPESSTVIIAKIGQPGVFTPKAGLGNDIRAAAPVAPSDDADLLDYAKSLLGGSDAD